VCGGIAEYANLDPVIVTVSVQIHQFALDLERPQRKRCPEVVSPTASALE
jgi:hypothetical protein